MKKAIRPHSGSGSLPAEYPAFFKEIKSRIRASQIRATLAANSELIRLYWDIGRALAERQKREGWGAAVIPRLAHDIRNELPEIKGFSERNLKYMIRFYREYGPDLIMQQSAAPLPASPKEGKDVVKMQEASSLPIVQQLVAQLPWGHNMILMDKIKDLPTRLWYMQKTLEHGWSRNILDLQISSCAHERQGKAIHNFHRTLPPPQSDLVEQALKDPYIFDFLTLAEPFHEREMETQLVRHLEKFLLELGQGFAFIGRQYHLEVDGEDFYIDLLFYHLRLRCFFVIELKKGSFKAEYAGKMNFYCNVVDDRLRHVSDNPTIGLILCQVKNRLVAEYALKGVRKAIGISEYQLTRALPKGLRSSLPSIAQIEKELSGVAGTAKKRSTKKIGGKK